MPESKACSRYVVAAGESVLTFAAATTLHEVKGRASDLSGFVEACFEDDGSLAVDPAPQMHVEFPVERLRSGNDLQDREMWRLIDSRRFPTDRGRPARVRAHPANRYLLRRAAT